MLHELADSAYFKRTMLIASAHNMPVECYPWRFSSVVSVGSHEEPDPLVFYANPDPPVEFFARGVDVERRVAGRQHDHGDRQQLRDAALARYRRARARQAPRADAVPAEDRALPDRDERGRLET